MVEMVYGTIIHGEFRYREPWGMPFLHDMGSQECWQHIIKKVCGGSERNFLDGLTQENCLLSSWSVGVFRAIPFGSALGRADNFAQGVLFLGFGGHISPLEGLWS